MAVTANSIVTPQTPKSNVVSLATANTNYTPAGVTNSVLLVTAGANGGRLTKLQAIPAATVSTANQIQMFRSLDSGVNKYFSDSVLMPIYSMAQNTQVPTTDFGYSDENPLILSANERIYVGEGQSVTVNVVAEWADY